MSDLSLGGLATGMDTASIIDQLVQLEQRPIYNYQQEISELEQTKGAWRDVNSRLDKLENRITDLKLSATYNSRTANSSDEEVVTATASNSSIEANYDITVRSTAKAQRIFGSKLADDYTASADDTITIKGTDIAVNSGDTFNDISNKINDAEAGVKASIVDDRLVLEASETGVNNALKDTADTGGATISDNSGILQELGVLNASGEIVNEPQQASDAEIEINGITGITSSNNEFSDAVEGVTFNIDPNAAVDSSATVSVAKDTGKATKAVQAFVDQYNSAMSFLDGKTDYDEETEKSAVLQGDSTAMRLQMRLRELVTSKVKDSGDYNTLTSVGIEIDRDGVMSFDSAKFTEALEDSPEEVMSIFNAESDSDGYDGMAVRMDSYLDQLMQSNTGLIPRRLDFYDTRIDGLNDDIEDVQRKVEMTRQRYVDQFSAMEEAISEMQSQQSWMMSQLQSMGGSTVSSMM
ncbi:flagellar filament capping protein FliD [Halanaerobium sp. ST460_2HS_T2]|uniref:flagellar filament capping protein FliD n=1 Tax=Halanaerobium sp. ST460_2HS_T2 TaxID=2183914 RepID=UPI000DF3C3B7|nr:flagellar filament capping protein FliD [Halanaerobium sp. ST460_2HS_T2]RCW58659.1 flagellar hook-associated protein 2 [Halanaerobium sp. ST460_2HS_T2]